MTVGPHAPSGFPRENSCAAGDVEHTCSGFDVRGVGHPRRPFPEHCRYEEVFVGRGRGDGLLRNASIHGILHAPSVAASTGRRYPANVMLFLSALGGRTVEFR